MLSIEVQEEAGVGHGAEFVKAGLELGHGGKRVRSEEEKCDVRRTIYPVTRFQTPHCSLLGMDPFLTRDSQKPSPPQMQRLVRLCAYIPPLLPFTQLPYCYPFTPNSFLVAKNGLGLYQTMPSMSGLLGLHC